MDNFAENVVEFNTEVLGIVDREKTLMSDRELEQTVRWLREEVDELLEAQIGDDFISAVDAIVDLMYFAIGGLHKLGLSPSEMSRCAEIIHDCNMEKKKGIVERRGDGTVPDAVKPAGWIPPEQRLSDYLGVSK